MKAILSAFHYRRNLAFRRTMLTHFDSSQRTMITVMAVDNLHAPLGHFYGQRRDIFTGNKRIAEFFNMRPIEFTNVWQPSSA